MSGVKTCTWSLVNLTGTYSQHTYSLKTDRRHWNLRWFCKSNWRTLMNDKEGKN